MQVTDSIQQIGCDRSFASARGLGQVGKYPLQAVFAAAEGIEAGALAGAGRL